MNIHFLINTYVSFILISVAKETWEVIFFSDVWSHAEESLKKHIAYLRPKDVWEFYCEAWDVIMNWKWKVVTL